MEMANDTHDSRRACSQECGTAASRKQSDEGSTRRKASHACVRRLVRRRGQERVLVRPDRVAGAHHLASIVDVMGLAATAAQRAQVSHDPVLP